MKVQVVYAQVFNQKVMNLQVPEGTTLSFAIQKSGILECCPEINQHTQVVGVYGEVIYDPDCYILDEGDRVEIYRPLKIDPKEARRQRALDASKAGM